MKMTPSVSGVQPPGVAARRCMLGNLKELLNLKELQCKREVSILEGYHRDSRWGSVSPVHRPGQQYRIPAWAIYRRKLAVLELTGN
jgi:hypothetical protein